MPHLIRDVAEEVFRLATEEEQILLQNEVLRLTVRQSPC
jgi:hypothetical protein